jgi:phage protein U
VPPEKVMMALGAFRFSVDTAAFQALQQSRQWSWVEQSRVGSQPLLQYTGKSLPTISISGTIYPEFKGGYQQVDKMIAEADKATPLTMITFDTRSGSNGRVILLGQWVILSISKTHRVLKKDGTPKAIEFSMELKQYIE